MNETEKQDHKQNDVNLSNNLLKILERSDIEIDRAYKVY
jgi:hypothetical protein